MKILRKFTGKIASYFSGELSKYFHFTKMLYNIYSIYGKYKANITIDKSKDCEDTDFGIYTNKDGNYAWRKLQIINPIL